MGVFRIRFNVFEINLHAVVAHVKTRGFINAKPLFVPRAQQTLLYA